MTYYGWVFGGHLISWKHYAEMCENYVCINCNLTTFFSPPPPPPSPFFVPLISPQTLLKQSHPAEMIKEAGIHLDTTPSHLASKGCSHWMDRLKNIAAMLDTDQHSHSIIFSLMIAHKCFWLLHLAPQMMEVVVCIHPYFPGCQKLHSEKAALLSSRVIIYLSKQESSQREGGLLGL